MAVSITLASLQKMMPKLGEKIQGWQGAKNPGRKVEARDKSDGFGDGRKGCQ
jgi:hypothetical protein